MYSHYRNNTKVTYDMIRMCLRLWHGYKKRLIGNIPPNESRRDENMTINGEVIGDIRRSLNIRLF